MLQVTAGNVFAYLDFAVVADRKLLILSCYDRSSMAVNGLCANIGLRMETTRIIEDGRIKASFQGPFDTNNYMSKVLSGKEIIYQGVSISKSVRNEYLVVSKKQWDEDLYSYFMTEFELPLLREWTTYIYTCAFQKKFIVETDVEIYGECSSLQEFSVLRSVMTNDDLKEIIQEGLESKKISIANTEQEALKFTDMDNYFERYGHTLVDNLEKLLNPLSPLKERVDELTYVSKRPFPQQAAIINGAIERLEHGNYVFLIESMGCGKTLQGMGIVEGFFVKKYLKQHPDVGIKDVYLDAKRIKYRVIVMCPPHLVEKWAESIREEIAYAKVEIIEELAQLIQLRKKGKTPEGKEFYILSKDSGKLSYSYRPIPYQMKNKKIAVPVCKECETLLAAEIDSACKCGCKERKIEKINNKAYGLICPECGELLLPAEGKIQDDGGYKILQPEDFAVQNTANHSCRCCGTILWAPTCRLLDTRILFHKPKEKNRKWKKISHFTNRAKKGRKSVWVMESREEIYKRENNITDEEVEEMDIYCPRRYSMTKYIKKYLKNFFDLAIFDEVQDYKSGGSAQGGSMHDLIKASKKQICLTGTIAGGYASDLFYTLYRLDSARMKEKGYVYGSAGEKMFVEKYGTIETIYDVEDKGEYHMMSRGKVITPVRCLPGISVLIFTEFLLDTALFLDISDLSRFLPHFYENVIMVPLEEEIQREYQRVRERIKCYMREEEKGKLLLGSFLQFSLSYTDMPYKRPTILSPANGDEVVEPADLSYLIEDGKLLQKEKALIELIDKEKMQNRNCFIYCEFTGDGEETISYRLKHVLEKNCGFSMNEVTVLESASPAAVKREEWMHRKASQGTKVFITNAKCVSTGLDFAFTYHGKAYNYPTIIFYQTGYDMIKTWQASRRSYRLNQTVECRVFYLVSEYTIQPDVVELIATKEVATSAIQGQFSMEGLATMAHGVDSRVILAQSMAEKSEQKERGLKKMMETINERNNQGKEIAEYEEMLIFSELTGLSEVPNYEEMLNEDEYIAVDDVLKLLYMGDMEEDIIDVKSNILPLDVMAENVMLEEKDAVEMQRETEKKEFVKKDQKEEVGIELASLLDLIF